MSVSKFGDYCPDFAPLERALVDSTTQVATSLAETVEDTIVVRSNSSPPLTTNANKDGRRELDKNGNHSSGEILRNGSVSDARGVLFSLLGRIRAESPADPCAYLALRALVWPQMTFDGQPVIPSPQSALRRELESLCSGNKWDELLSLSEGSFAENNAFLDLQRYSIEACRGLGYSKVAEALEESLRHLLKVSPNLLTAGFDDGTDIANAATQQWLRANVFRTLAISQSASEVLEASPDNTEERSTSAFTSGRDIFFRRARKAALLIQQEQYRIAAPLLTGLTANLDKDVLLEWEGPLMLVDKLADLHHCLVKTGAPEDRRRQVFDRICELDPDQALALSSE